MKKYTTYLFALFSLFISGSYAQDNAEVDLIDDMLLIADNFANPAAEGAAYQASAGWFTSALALKEWEVEFSVHGNALVVPSSRKESSISNSQFNILNVRGESGARVPTAFGERSEVYYEGQVMDQSIEFMALEGVDKGFVAHPFLQASVGLPYETEVAVRALPQITVDDVGFSTYGMGLKHNISQYFKFNDADDFQLAAIIAYSKFNVNYAFEPVHIEIASLDLIDVDADLWLFEALGSKRYEDFEIFGALGATNSNFAYAMGGSGGALPRINEALETLDHAELQFKGDIGFNFYFDQFKVSTMATAGKFFNVNLGLHYRI